MDKVKFEAGVFHYHSAQNASPREIEKIQPEEWSDGYIAFSNCEKRLKQVEPALLKDLFARKAVGGIEGYVMEMNLWRKINGSYEELAIERDDHGFHLQKWSLVDHPNEKEAANCFYRLTDAMVRDPIGATEALFHAAEWQIIEVIVPDTRLNVFMTAPRS